MSTTFTCPRCGTDEPSINVTTFGDREPRLIPGQSCDCPGPRCPFCHVRLDDEGRCNSMPVIDCFAGGLLIPIPDIA